ncbi:DUF4124 domain-containing protein [Ideonella sp.]|uniref:DUF4124 domain-containing protein n=1 Tax=Ideonella sp. TaxID=1929293 RepID=UPI002B47F55F|nr:DUF4124 domain-containing protein [Ideonella sp.]HJV72331.1 DUF4124 domain-containing protein [Ideonella sp.]HSN34229.1 DUF4124 domain-containing protein [Ideonella sp.]
MRAVAAGLLIAAAAASAGAATPPRPGESAPATPIYTCVDAQGHRLSSDRPIPECLSQDQRLLNRDGTLKAVVPPAQSPEEKARQEAAKRQAEQIRLAREAEARRDRALLARYPDQATHDEARARAQEPVTRQVEAARRRLAELEVDTQALASEREALGKKPMPQAMRARVAANEGAIEAQRTILRDQEAERERLTLQFDAELARLRALWAGAAPGRMGPIVVPSAPARGASAP